MLRQQYCNDENARNLYIVLQIQMCGFFWFKKKKFLIK